jgi:hypothetical protein
MVFLKVRLPCNIEAGKGRIRRGSDHVSGAFGDVPSSTPHNDACGTLISSTLSSALLVAAELQPMLKPLVLWLAAVQDDVTREER